MTITAEIKLRALGNHYHLNRIAAWMMWKTLVYVVQLNKQIETLKEIVAWIQWKKFVPDKQILSLRLDHFPVLNPQHNKRKN